MTDLFFHDPRFRVRRLPEPELRKDPVVDRWTIVSTDRLSRAQEVHESVPPSPVGPCPFCAGNESLTPHESFVLGDGAGWQIRVVPNAFPALRRMEEFRSNSHNGYESHSGWGVHEVVIECPHHEANLANLSVSRFADLFRIYRQRIRTGKDDPRLVYPMIFKNCGASAGASLEHAHSQILLMPCVPQVVRDELEAANRFRQSTGHCIFCDLRDRERAAGIRMIAESAEFTAFAAFAGRFPFETWIVPARHASHFDEISDDQADDLAKVMRTVLRKLSLGLSDPPYNYYIHTAPWNEPASAYHWHMEILPRVTGTAGFEWGTGFAINPVPPEQAAEYLRSVSIEGDGT
jgi:UDPglucose--hexose-1-phosphate uridylyltransferase